MDTRTLYKKMDSFARQNPRLFDSLQDSTVILREIGVDVTVLRRVIVAVRMARNTAPRPSVQFANQHCDSSVNTVPDQFQEIFTDRCLCLDGRLSRIAWRIRLRVTLSHGNFPFTTRPFAPNPLGDHNAS